MCLKILLLACFLYAVDCNFQVLNHSGDWCPQWKNIKCSSDGISYWNDCLFEKSKALLGNRTASPGVCEEVECNECQDKNDDYNFCSSSNKLLKSQCMFDCFAEKYPDAKEDFDSCNIDHPSVEEMEVASIDLLTHIVQSFLNHSFRLEEYENPQHHLESFTGAITHTLDVVTLRAYGGWISELTSMGESGSFNLSASNPGQILIKLNRVSLEAGYRYFMISSTNVPLQIVVSNVSLQLVAEFDATATNCTRIKPIELEVADMANLEILNPHNRTVHVNIPKHGVEGVLKENVGRRMNNALRNTLFKRMSHINCLSWPPSLSSHQHCFGAFQKKFCNS